MGSAGVQIVCVSLGVLGLIGVIKVMCCPTLDSDLLQRSKRRDPSEKYGGPVDELCGAEYRPAAMRLGLFFPSDLQAARAMTIISCMLSCLSLLILHHCTCVQNEDMKPKISLVAGIGLMLASLLVIIPISWSTHIVVRDFNNPIQIIFETELGACIFVGWGAGVLLLLAGGLLCCFSRPKSGSSGGNTYSVLQL